MLDDADYCLILTTSLSADMLKPVRQGTLTTAGTVEFSSKNLEVSEALLLEERQRKIAT